MYKPPNRCKIKSLGLKVYFMVKRRRDESSDRHKLRKMVNKYLK